MFKKSIDPCTLDYSDASVPSSFSKLSGKLAVLRAAFMVR